MDISKLTEFTQGFIEISVLIFVFCIGLAVLFLAILYIIDVNQKGQTIRRNYPIIGRLRYKFEELGVFFRQYFFAQDRDEFPFNRAQRSWVYRSAKNIDSTVAFGSTYSLKENGAVLFLNAPFPVQSFDSEPPKTITFGEKYAEKPYRQNAIINISGMSFGAISIPAVTALSMGAAKAGSWMNTGEGGLSPYHLKGKCDIVFQIGTAKYGVRDLDGGLSENKLREIAAITQVKMFELKLSQGAKPGKGGILPAVKVTAEIAAIRGITAGEDSISPNGHTDIHSVTELLKKIKYIRDITGKPTGFKFVLGQQKWLEELCQKIHSMGLEYAPDFITLDSSDGGTGAAPQSLIDSMGLPIGTSLPIVIDTFIANDLRSRIKVISSGRLINPIDVAWAYATGVDFVTSARGFMFAIGCIQALQCNKNTCPTGITTHNKKLQKGLVVESKLERVAYFAKNMAKEVGVIANSCGVSQVRALKRDHFKIVSGNENALSVRQL